MKGISTTIQKLNKDYKPLGVAVFLAIGGLLSGFLWSSVFVTNPAGTVQERRVQGGPELIPQADGAELDSAALTPQSAPFLASADTGSVSSSMAENVDVLYGKGAVRDPEQVVKTITAAPANHSRKTLASGIIYKVSAGDTLTSISAEFNIPIDTIVEFNPSVNFSPLDPGISIIVPSQKDVSLLLAS
jgi:LysM repeat protein